MTSISTSPALSNAWTQATGNPPTISITLLPSMFLSCFLLEVAEHIRAKLSEPDDTQGSLVKWVDGAGRHLDHNNEIIKDEQATHDIVNGGKATKNLPKRWILYVWTCFGYGKADASKKEQDSPNTQPPTAANATTATVMSGAFIPAATSRTAASNPIDPAI
jgi:hypothetical protein